MAAIAGLLMAATGSVHMPLIAGLTHKLEELDLRRDELSDLDHSDKLGEEIQKAQSALAEGRAAVERYIPLHLAAEFSGWKSKGKPVLARASEIFPQLTLGSFAKVATQHSTKDIRLSWECAKTAHVISFILH